MRGRRRHHPARSIVTWLALAALGAGAGTARAQPVPRLPAPPLPPVPVVHPPLPPPPPLPVPAPPEVVVQTAPAEGPAYAPPPAQPTYAPPAQPAQPPPVINGWQPDDPIPEGYRKISKPNVGYLGIGIGMLSAGWVTSVVAAAAETDVASKSTEPGALGPEAWVPLFFPVVGPFVTIFTAKQGTQAPAGMGLLICDGIFQTAGLLGVLVGGLRWTHRLVRVGGADVRLDVTPAAGPGFAGIHTIGTF